MSHEAPNSGIKPLWVVDDVAHYLRISKDEVYRLVERFEIPHTRLFKRRGIRFHPDEIVTWARVERKVLGSGGSLE